MASANLHSVDVYGKPLLVACNRCVTANAAPSTTKYRDRMPLILEEGQFDEWKRRPPEIATK
jgi:putative SOS response-associated peptidase YedK